jgi:exopolyphosphatase/guanosine-5'-triphosphate,3'-diphosphate pyrophosphatase
MRLGVLDVGSNSVKLQVVDGRSGAPPLKTSAFKASVRLAECTDGDGAITDAGSARLLDATKRAVAGADAPGVTELIGFATAAIRDARNGSELCALLDHAAGVPMRALTGDDEARFTFLAARRWFGWSAGPLLVLDIEGGSLEVACGRDEEPDVAVSLPLGAGRLTRDYLSEQPPSPTRRATPS